MRDEWTRATVVSCCGQPQVFGWKCGGCGKPHGSLAEALHPATLALLDIMARRPMDLAFSACLDELRPAEKAWRAAGCPDAGHPEPLEDTCTD